MCSLSHALPWTSSIFPHLLSLVRPRVCPREEPSFTCCFPSQPRDPNGLAFAHRSPTSPLCRARSPSPFGTGSSLPSSYKPWPTTRGPCCSCWPLHMLAHEAGCRVSSTEALADPQVCELLEAHSLLPPCLQELVLRRPLLEDSQLSRRLHPPERGG